MKPLNHFTESQQCSYTSVFANLSTGRVKVLGTLLLLFSLATRSMYCHQFCVLWTFSEQVVWVLFMCLLSDINKIQMFLLWLGCFQCHSFHYILLFYS